jgi:tRNA dimethylallyltransferase
MGEGFLAEVAQLRERGDLTRDHPAIRAVGYRQLWSFLAGDFSLEEAVRRTFAATRQLAKRQLTWLRQHHDAFWYDPLETDATARMSQQLHEALGFGPRT